MRRRYSVPVGQFLAALVLVFTPLVCVTAQYTIVALPEPRGMADCAARASSNAGHIVGHCMRGGFAHAVRWREDSSGRWIATDLHQAGYVSTEAIDVNDAGNIVGFGQRARALSPQPLSWISTTDWLGGPRGYELRTPPFKITRMDAANGINNEDAMVGAGLNSNGEKAAWRLSWSPTLSGRIAGQPVGASTPCVASAINDPGDVVGECGGRAFFFRGDSGDGCRSCPTSLPLAQSLRLPEASREFGGHAHAVNNARTVVGWALYKKGGTSARLWRPSGAGWTEVDVPPAVARATQPSTRAVAINDAGQILVVDDVRNEGWLVWAQGTQFEIVPLSPSTGDSAWRGLLPSDITNTGRIVGVGRFTRSSTRRSVSRAFVMIPSRTPGLTPLDFRPEALNNRGHVVGENILWLDARHRMELAPNILTDEVRCVLCDIDDRDLIAGRTLVAGSSVPTIWTGTDGVWQSTLLPLGVSNGGLGVAIGVGASDVVVGYRRVVNSLALEWSRGVLLSPAPACSRQFSGAALAKVNAMSYAAGRCTSAGAQRATDETQAAHFSARFGTLIVGGAIASSGGQQPNSDAINVNSRGQTVGWVERNRLRQAIADRKGFLWNPITQGTTMLRVPPSMQLNEQTGANAINSRGHIVGHALIMGVFTAMMWRDGPSALPIDLNTVMPARDWHLNDAFDINDAGQILVSGIDRSGGTVYFLLTLPHDY